MTTEIPDGGLPTHALVADERVFRSGYNRTSFQFKHNLNRQPLFDLDSMLDLARTRGDDPKLAYWSNGAARIGDGWEFGLDRRMSLEATLSNIAKDDSLVLLKHVELDRRFGPVVKELMSYLVELSGPRLKSDVSQGRGTIVVASPGRITSYHMDSDTNFLFQIRGDKIMHVFDRRHGSTVSDPAMEDFFCGNLNAAVFEPDRRQALAHYNLVAGSGVHIPSTDPHWAQNLTDVSIALSINFDLRSVERCAKIYRANRRLRALGMSPTPPGASRWRDDLKLMMGDAVRRIRTLQMGSSSDLARAVKVRGPDGVMCQQSSSRTPNSPGM